MWEPFFFLFYFSENHSIGETCLTLFPGLDCDVTFQMTGKHTEVVMSLEQKKKKREDIRRAFAAKSNFKRILGGWMGLCRNKSTHFIMGRKVIIASGAQNIGGSGYVTAADTKELFLVGREKSFGRK
jgi:hypothetical protein